MTNERKSLWTTFPSTFTTSFSKTTTNKHKFVSYPIKKDLIFQVLSLSVIPAIRLGFFPFSFNEKNLLSFSWSGLPIFGCVLRFLSSFITLIVYYYNDELYRSIYGDPSKTETYTEYSVFVCSTFGEAALISILISQRKSVYLFYKEFRCLLQTVVKNSSALNSYFKYIKWLGKLVHFVYFFDAIKTTVVHVVILGNLNQVKSWSTVSLPFVALIWKSFIIHRLVSRIWIVSIVYCFVILVLEIRKELESCLQPQVDERGIQNRKIKLELALKNYRRVERIVEQFNHYFGVYLTISLLSLMIIITMNVFETILYAKHGSILVAIDFVLSGVVHFSLLYATCLVGSWFEVQVK